MQAEQPLNLEQIRAFLEASDEVGFEDQNREEVYGGVNRTLGQQRYRELPRRSRGLVRHYLEKMTGLGRAQITRLITMFLAGETVQPKPYNSIGCGKATPIGNDGWPISRPGRRRRRLGNGAGQSRTTAPVTCGWIQCIQEIETESRGYTTLMRWMKSRNGR